MENDKFKSRNSKSRIVVVGGAVAGASAAIRLALLGFQVSIVEKERFPRQKLCGEFISPECFPHFQQLGVFEEMQAAGGDSISETVFYAPNGKSVTVPSAWFGHGKSAALGISRAEMDFQLLERARRLGVEVFEETSAVGLLQANGEICGVRAKKKSGEQFEIKADLTIDASGRAGVLAKFLKHAENQPASRQAPSATRLVGFKAHLKGANISAGVCEIYFFRGGYGGLNRVEGGVSNHCFLVDAKLVREFGGDADKIVREVVFKNRRAEEMLHSAKTVYDWLAVSVGGFGRKNLAAAPRLLAIGDAGAFIDPFTGSGMLMALESGEIAANAIAGSFNNAAAISSEYQIGHRQKFQRRLRVCSVLRRAAFFPNLAGAAIYALNFSRTARQALARATRPKISELS
ncbi:MAG TPA: NAD(P)/FAD-dependent oxidoreductase [Pyrinomonadaceae bacterium]|nr:NAD(P)/FAD-dependent oxidoreductase [Pyrinomonadaceae bacterium]